MSDYRVLPCRRCGHIWKWAVDKKSVPYCPDGYGCANKKENQMTDRMKEMVKEIVYSDFADEIIIYRLESVVEDCFDYLDQIKNLTNNEHLFDDYYDNILMIRGCIQVLKWFTINDYQDTVVKVNQYSRKFEEMF